MEHNNHRECLGQVLILQAISTLAIASKLSSYTRLSSLCTYTVCGESEFCCTYTHTRGDHAQIQDYDDSTHCELVYNKLLPT